MTAPDDAAPHGLGPDWVRGTDGLLFRHAARVILIDAGDRVLLMRGHDIDEPARSWWFTIGGGIESGEDSRAAAVREVFEETGLVLDGDALVGPVVRRSAIFDFYAEHCRQHEEIFLVRLDTAGAEVEGLSKEGWTEVEQNVLDELRWWELDALATVTEEVFPAELVELVRDLLPGWDGVTRDLGTARSTGR